MPFKDYEMPATSIAGVATGLTLSEFIAEFVARVSGQVGWAKVGVKGAVKGVFALLCYTLASKFVGLSSLFLELMTYTSVGSWILDVAFQLYPGGVPGMAEVAAVQVRIATLKKGVERMAEDEVGGYPAELDAPMAQMTVK